MKTSFITQRIIIVATVAAALGISHGARAAERDWANTGTDFNTGANWGGTAPGAGDVAWFKVAEVTNPNLSTSLSIAGFYFGDKLGGTTSSGYDITSSSAAIAFTLTGTATTTGGSETSNSGAAAIGADNTSGTNTIDAPIVLGGADGSTQTFKQAAGGTLIVNGAVSNTNNVTLSVSTTGTVQLNGANTYTGGTAVNGATLVIGDDSALGAGTLTSGTSAATTIQAGGGARTIANNVVWGGNGTVSGSNDLTVNGSFTSSGSAGRTITVNGVNLTLGGNVYLAESDTARGLTFAGSGTTTVDGVITNNAAANTVASDLTLNSTTGGTLVLNGANTYTGNTTLTSGNLILGNNGAFGNGGTVSWNGVSTSASTTLTGANALPNANRLGGDNTFTGANSIELSGPTTATGSRTITNNMTGGAILTFSGNFNLSNSGANRVVTFNGTGNTAITGAVVDGGTSTSSIVLDGGGLRLTHVNNYSGGTTINAGTLIASHDGALGAGNVSLTASGTILTLQNGALNDYIANNAILSLVTGSIVNLNFNGTDTIGGLIVDGVMQGPGIYNNSTTSELMGTGNLLIVPEPGTLMLLGLGAGLLGAAQGFRRRRS
jgi:fibronectin-binding autotransporter adhesin